jgi:hypothetical protein
VSARGVGGLADGFKEEIAGRKERSVDAGDGYSGL